MPLTNQDDNQEEDLLLSDSALLALDDADDFNDNSLDGTVHEDTLSFAEVDDHNPNVFTEIVPLTADFSDEKRPNTACENLNSYELPDTLYMLVDKTVELDPKPLREFPQWSFLPEIDLNRKAISLFFSQRTAKRNCSRSQRVIKVPDTSVFHISAPFLLSRGITRLVLEDSLIALDTPKESI